MDEFGDSPGDGCIVDEEHGMGASINHTVLIEDDSDTIQFILIEVERTDVIQGRRQGDIFAGGPVKKLVYSSEDTCPVI